MRRGGSAGPGLLAAGTLAFRCGARLVHPLRGAPRYLRRPFFCVSGSSRTVAIIRSSWSAVYGLTRMCAMPLRAIFVITAAEGLPVLAMKRTLRSIRFSAAINALDVDLAAVQLDELPRQREAKSRPAETARRAGLQLLEFGEEPTDVLGADADAIIRHDQAEALVIDGGDVDTDVTVIVGELQCIGEQVEEDLLEPLLVERDEIEAVLDREGPGTDAERVRAVVVGTLGHAHGERAVDEGAGGRGGGLVELKRPLDVERAIAAVD